MLLGESELAHHLPISDLTNLRVYKTKTHILKYYIYVFKTPIN